MSEYFGADGEPTVLGRARARYGSDERGGWPDPHRRRSFDAALAAHDQKVKAKALREAASILPEATEGIDRVGTSDWAARDRDIYSLAIEEAAEALLDRADHIESQGTP